MSTQVQNSWALNRCILRVSVRTVCLCVNGSGPETKKKRFTMSGVVKKKGFIMTIVDDGPPGEENMEEETQIETSGRVSDCVE